jgi:hypothetical protein
LQDKDTDNPYVFSRHPYGFGVHESLVVGGHWRRLAADARHIDRVSIADKPTNRVDITCSREPDMRHVGLAYVAEMNGRPTRVEALAVGRGWVLVLDRRRRSYLLSTMGRMGSGDRAVDAGATVTRR